MPKRSDSKLYIGVDIGKDGAIAVQDGSKPIATFPFPLISREPDYQKFFQILCTYSHREVHVVFEDLHSIFGASAKSNFSFGGICHATEMACIALELPYTKIRATVWQAELFVGVKEVKKPGKNRRDTKAMALLAVKRLFPKQNLLATPRSTVPHDGIVDAILLSEYCKRKF